MSTQTVFLEGLKFYAHHGVLAHESQLGNNFEVDVHIEFDNCQAKTTDNLANTLDYVKVYEVIKKHFQVPCRLLEHLGNKIMEDLAGLDGSIRFIALKIKKLNPPLGGPCGSSGIVLEYKPADYGDK